MKQKKRFFRLLTAWLCLGLCFCQPAQAAIAGFQQQQTAWSKGFIDVMPDQWYYQAVMESSAFGLLQGYEDGRFAPEAPISLAEVAALAVRIYETYYGIVPGDVQAAAASPVGPLDGATSDGTETPALVGTADAAAGSAATAAVNTAADRALTAEEAAGTVTVAADSANAAAAAQETADIGVAAAVKESVVGATATVAGDTTDGIGAAERTPFSAAVTAQDAAAARTEHAVEDTVSPATSSGAASTSDGAVSPGPAAAALATFLTEESSTGGNLAAGGGSVALPSAGTQDLTESAALMEQTTSAGIDTHSENAGDSHSPAVLPQQEDTPLAEEQPAPEESGTEPGEPWYQSYVERAVAYQLLPAQWQEYNEPASRRRAVYLLARALPSTEFTVKNDVSQIPDLAATEFGYEEVLRCYQAGILSGSDAYGRFLPDTNISRAEISALVVRLLQPEQRLEVEFPVLPQHQVFSYGQSGAGRDLTVHRIGNGKNVLVCVFGLHGYEDGWPQDGVELKNIAQGLIQQLTAEQVVTVRDWSVYVIPCANPDGLQDGWTANGPGRCTTHVLNADGQVVYGQGKGVDLNRCFEFGFSINNTRRNYTGNRPLGAIEAVALKSFVQSVYSSEGVNILLDVHGWTQQLIAKNPHGKLTQFFANRFPQNRLTYNGAHGYLTEWSQSIGFDSLLFEFPRDVRNHATLVQKQYDAKWIQCVVDLLNRY